MSTSVDFTFLKITNTSRRNTILFERIPEPLDTLGYFQRSQKIHRTHFTATKSKNSQKKFTVVVELLYSRNDFCLFSVVKTLRGVKIIQPLYKWEVSMVKNHCKANVFNTAANVTNVVFLVFFCFDLQMKKLSAFVDFQIFIQKFGA